MFSFGPDRLTKEILLNYKKEEEYFTFYLGIIPSTKMMYRSPFREDHNPSCCFYRTRTGELRFKDFSRNEVYSVVDVVSELFKVPFKEALKIMAIDFGLIEKPNYAKNEPKAIYDGTIVEDTGPAVIQCCIKEYTKEELKWWDDRGVTERTLKKFNVFSVSSVFVNGINVFSSTDRSYCFGYYFGKKDGVEQWKIYFPQRPKGSKFLCNTDVIQGLKQLPKDGGDVLVVTKSYKDVMALSEHGIPAIATQGESIILSNTVYTKLRPKYKLFIFNGDWDHTGKMFIINSLTHYDGVPLTFKNKEKYAKDFSDFILKFGRYKAEKLIAALLSKYEGLCKIQEKYSRKRKKQEEERKLLKG